MITLVVPTRNRARILRRTAPSFFEVRLVDEIIIVDDAGSDDTRTILEEIGASYSGTDVGYIRNPERLGASQSRNIGVAAARNDLILFCDDDEILEQDYAQVCLEKMREHGASVVSGRRVYMLPGETPEGAVARFGSGLRRTRPYLPILCEYVNGAVFQGDLEIPITNAVILTRRNLLQAHPFDPFYARGNGYREETDFQMNLYTRGHKIVVTNACHSIHLPMAEVSSGGQRTSAARRTYWSIYYTGYFYRKYYQTYAKRQGLRAPRWAALLAFSVYAIYRNFLRPRLYAIAMTPMLRRVVGRPGLA